MSAVMLPLDVVGNITSSLTPGIGRVRSLRPGDGRCMADHPARPCLRRLCELRPGASFVCRLTRALGKVLGPAGRGGHAVQCLLAYRGSEAGRRVVRTLAPAVLVEVLG